MNAKKQRDKNKRRASKLAEQAWEAADDGNFDLAVKIIRRAVDLHPGNPVLWHDQGALLVQLNADESAAQSFQTALQLAPDFADAYASLAAIRARQGQADLAVTLMREAVRHAPQTERHQTALAAYEALFVDQSKAAMMVAAASSNCLEDKPIEAESPSALLDLANRIENLSWPEIDDRLTGHGYAHVPGLLLAEQCESLRTMFHDNRLFAKTVTMSKNRFGRGVYRYFAAPIPPLVEAIRRLVYPHVAETANRWQHLLEDDNLYPADWPGFQRRCEAAGQTTPSPLILRYEAGGFNAPHQDIRGEVFFPVQLVVVLSPRGAGDFDEAKDVNNVNGFTGGEFVFCDQPERKPSDRRAIPAGLGDAVLFCTRARLVRVGGVYGLQPVQHGMDRIFSGTRYAIGIPFHEFA